MNAKLTLSVKQEVIEQAKAYAKEKGTSVSKIFEDYLKSISGTPKQAKKRKISPFIQSFSGLLEPMSKDDIRAEYGAYLEKKYT